MLSQDFSSLTMFVKNPWIRLVGGMGSSLCFWLLMPSILLRLDWAVQEIAPSAWQALLLPLGNIIAIIFEHKHPYCGGFFAVMSVIGFVVCEVVWFPHGAAFLVVSLAHFALRLIPLQFILRLFVACKLFIIVSGQDREAGHVAARPAPSWPALLQIAIVAAASEYGIRYSDVLN